MVRHYRDLVVWQRAMDLAEAVYRASGDFPREEIYGLTSQVRRAVVSVASNIAEWQGRGGPEEFVHGLNIAYGSLQEVETQLMIALRLNYMTQNTLDQLLSHSAEVGRLINGLIRALKRKCAGTTITDHQQSEPLTTDH